jgi:hypothetical protein
MYYSPFSDPKFLLGLAREAERVRREFIGITPGSPEALRRVRDYMDRQTMSPTRALQEAARQRGPYLHEMPRDQSRALVEALREAHIKARKSPRSAREPDVVQQTVAVELPEISTEEQALVADVISDHLGGVVERMLTTPGEKEASEVLREAGEGIGRTLAERLSDSIRERVSWEKIVAILTLLLTLVGIIVGGASYLADRADNIADTGLQETLVEQFASGNTLQRDGNEVMEEIRDRLPLTPGVYRSTERLRVRREPELDAEVLRVLDAGEPVHVEEVRGAWVRVRLTGEPDGWASAEHLTRSG